MSTITFGDGALEALVVAASHIPYGRTVALLNDGEELPIGPELKPGTDVKLIACDERGVTYAGLDADGQNDGTTGLRPWIETERIHVY